jgi:dipeptidyl-peptidase-3
MNAQELSSYLADAPPSVVRLEIAKHFDALTDKQKRYAHFISQYDYPYTGLSARGKLSSVAFASP